MDLSRIHELITETKQYWDVINFNNEILQWNFKTDIKSNTFCIGHPIGSHKGPSIGDMIAYTSLPRLIKQKYNNCNVNIPPHFKPLFKNNPYVDSFIDHYERWGSLGPFGNTIQRTCNVWGIQTWDTSPELYPDLKNIENNTLLLCVNSKTGGTIKNDTLIYEIVEELKSKYYCVQLLMQNETPIKNCNELIYNLSTDKLINFINSFSVYVGAQNSIYHIAKGLNLNVVTLLPENIDPDFVMLPLLTQINHLELEMLPENERERSQRWISKMKALDKDPFQSHHIGWLYPDSCHLTMRPISNNFRCPSASPNFVKLAIEKNIYPFNNEELWRPDKHSNLWV